MNEPRNEVDNQVNNSKERQTMVKWYNQWEWAWQSQEVVVGPEVWTVIDYEYELFN